VICALAIAGVLYRLWVKAGRPRGLAEAEMLAEASPTSDAEQPPEALTRVDSP
jgi:hypothetical protein